MAIGAAIVSAVVGSVISGGIAAATAPGIPGSPNYGQATAAGVAADLETLPMRRKIEAAARLGQKVTYETGQSSPIYGTQKMVMVNSGKTSTLVPYVPSDFVKGGKYFGQPQNITEKQVITGYTPSTATADFTGIGDIQNQAKLADQMAKITLENQQKYGVDFVNEALRQEALADPQGVAARKLLAQKIQDQAALKPERPVAAALQQQLSGDLGAGASLSDDDKAAIQRSIVQRQAMGDAPTADLSSVFTEGAAGNARNQARQQHMLSFMTSGATPEDVAYRQSQQNMSNLGSYVAGTNPVTQFGSLSGAQKGASPTPYGPSLTGVNPNAGALGASMASGNYASKISNQANQANPWMAGMSLALQGAGTLATATTKK